MTLLSELKRRNVIRAVVLYVGAVWALAQGIAQLAPVFGFSNAATRWFVIAACVGFPFWVAFAWLYEFTPDGIQRESELAQNTARNRRAGRRMDRWIIVVLSVAVVLLVANALIPREPAPAPAAATRPAALASMATAHVPDKSIAVLPFTDLSPARDQEYFSDGMAEELLNALARVKDLKVAGRTSSFSFKGRNQDLRQIGKALGVATVLEGSVRKQGDRVRITAQLIQVSDGFNLWSEAYDGDLKDVFALQERIARAITQALQVVLVGDQKQQLVPVATGNPEAYALFLQATAIFNRRDAARFPEAIGKLEQAIALDPGYARAYARLAGLYAISPGYMDIEPASAVALTERNARVAMRLAPSLAEPYAALGFSYSTQRRRLQARPLLERAAALDPADATVQFWLGVNLIMSGYTAQGRAQLDRALAIDPLYPNALGWRGLEHVFAGELDAAHRMLAQATQVGLAYNGQNLAALAQREGRNADATRLDAEGMRSFLVGFPADANLVLARGYHGTAADRAAAIALLDAYLAGKPRPIVGIVPFAFMRLGDPERAMAVAGPAPTSNEAALFQTLWSDEGRQVRTSPRFPAFLRQVGLAGLWDRYGPADRCKRRAPGDYACE